MARFPQVRGGPPMDARSENAHNLGGKRVAHASGRLRGVIADRNMSGTTNDVCSGQFLWTG